MYDSKHDFEIESPRSGSIIHAPNLFVPVDLPLPLPLLKVFQLARQTQHISFHNPFIIDKQEDPPTSVWLCESLDN